MINIALNVIFVAVAAICAREYGINGESIPAYLMTAVSFLGMVNVGFTIREEMERSHPAPYYA